MHRSLLPLLLATLAQPFFAQTPNAPFAAARIDVTSLGPLTGPTSEAERLPMFIATGQEQKLIAPGIDAIANDLFSLIVEIAVDRARREGLALVHDELTTLVCGLRFHIMLRSKTAHAEPVFSSHAYPLTQTCNLIRSTDLQALIGQGRALRAGLTSDLISIAEGEIDNNPDITAYPPLAAGAHAGLALLRRFANDPDLHLSRDDVWLVADAVINSSWTSSDPPTVKQLQVALMAARAYLKALEAGTKPDLAFIIRQVIAAQCAGACDTPETKARIDEWASLAVKMVAGMTADTTKEDYRVRLRSALKLVFDSLDIIANVDPAAAKVLPAWVRVVALAALDADAPHLISALADAASKAIPFDCVDHCQEKLSQQRKLAALLSGISTYAITYVAIPANSTAAEIAALQQQQHDARKSALEGVIDAATDRRARARDRVVSLGAGVGFSYNKTYRLDRAFSKEQLHVPLGVALQILPGGWKKPGFYVMGTALDLGNYARASKQDAVPSTPTAVPKLDWTSIISPGAQVGVALGRPNTFFVVGLGVNYTPRPATTESTVGLANKTGLKVGLFVQYYFSLWDFN
jgi:hypothetical protein